MTKIRVFFLVACMGLVAMISWLSQPPASAEIGAVCEVIRDHTRAIANYEAILGEVSGDGQWMVLDSIDRLKEQRELKQRLLGSKGCEY